MQRFPSNEGKRCFMWISVMWIKKFFKIGLLIKTKFNFVND